jgi:acetyl esterase
VPAKIMPLDAESAKLLAERRKIGVAPVSGQSVAEVRASRRAWREKTSGPAAPVHATQDVEVPTAAGAVPVRAYRPDERGGLPVIVFFHGGGWVLGDLGHSDLLCRWLCRESGCLVVNVDYRLAPEHPYPAAIDDAYAVLTWLFRGAAGLGVDPRQLAVAGASAGGNIAAAVAMIARDRGAPPLAAELLIYPCLDAACATASYAEFADGYIVSTEDMRWYWRQYVAAGKQTEPYAAPLHASDLAGLPPTLIITAEYDCVRDDGERYADRLKTAGVPVRLHRYEGTLHGFFSTPGTSGRGSEAVREAAGFLSGALVTAARA